MPHASISPAAISIELNLVNQSNDGRPGRRRAQSRHLSGYAGAIANGYNRRRMERSNFGLAWILLCLALVLHVIDETLTNFLGVYNPTAIAIRERVPWLPVPAF